MGRIVSRAWNEVEDGWAGFLCRPRGRGFIGGQRFPGLGFAQRWAGFRYPFGVGEVWNGFQGFPLFIPAIPRPAQAR